MVEKADPWLVEKRAAAGAAALVVEEGKRVGIGSGSPVAHFISAQGRRHLQVRCGAASPESDRLTREAGLLIGRFDVLDTLELAVDGADQVAPDLWLVKGGGGAHTREKVVAAAAQRFVVIVSPNKLVDRLEPPIPLEILGFGLHATLRLEGELGPVKMRPGPPNSRRPATGRLPRSGRSPSRVGCRLRHCPRGDEPRARCSQLVSEVIVGRRNGTTDRRKKE